MSLNRVMMIGNLGQDPEIRYTPSGLPLVNFSVATDEPCVDKEGKRQGRVEWHRIVVIGKLALTCNEYLKKGRQVFARVGCAPANTKPGSTVASSTALNSLRVASSFSERRPQNRSKCVRLKTASLRSSRSLRFDSEWATPRAL